ncbi:hypothetical protein [Paucibacter sp. DJ2R-2]|uniref:hypothetical protein n=1 Tax=Paucibacter sp. DJ2R-2 TaxID=2893558 RepID=UPI0021E36ABF|nr:hypothetical protein [Paucibacter sp. DJ2R-2]MCV2439275.1 hypothetical protein [Paucibacter sp. DJ2R-2]
MNKLFFTIATLVVASAASACPPDPVRVQNPLGTDIASCVDGTGLRAEMDVALSGIWQFRAQSKRTDGSSLCSWNQNINAVVI